MSISAFRSTEYVIVKSKRTSRFLHPETGNRRQLSITSQSSLCSNRKPNRKNQIANRSSAAAVLLVLVVQLFFIRIFTMNSILSRAAPTLLPR